MIVTMTITEFLLARIAEDEAWARLAQDSSDRAPWQQGTGPFKSKVNSYAGLGIAETRGINVARFIARHDPARMLAECEAKLRIVEWAAEDIAKADARDDDDTTRSFTAGAAFRSHNVLQTLAAVYADHPDYRDEWRP